ncbi:MAG: tRNA glutamyl-Q(34) synthetase GluQRS [Succinivibrionaceae bacterium]
MYVGRFAPTPSGNLHLGSLTTAVGSYLRAKSFQGKWLLRIEDLDQPRCPAGASDNILRTLEKYHLHYDGTVLYQSQNIPRYEEIIARLQQQGFSYYCNCSRHRLQEIGGIYDGKCGCRPENTPLNTKEKYAIRFRNPGIITSFKDILLGELTPDLSRSGEDFILKRRDGIIAYNLAVVVDDYDTGVTEVVRGSDLIDTTAAQLNLASVLNFRFPDYLHLPLILQKPGIKYSKQNHARRIDDHDIPRNCALALECLGLDEPWELRREDPGTQLQWAVSEFQTRLIPKKDIIVTY